MGSMIIEPDRALLDVFSSLHAQSIVAAGGVKESIQDLKCGVMRVVYETKAKDDVTDEVLADLLGITQRWLRMLGDTRPAPQAASDCRRILRIVQTGGDWMSFPEICIALRESGDETPYRRVLRLLTGLHELGQLDYERRDGDRYFRTRFAVRLLVARKKQERTKAAGRMLSPLVSTVNAFMASETGAMCSTRRHRVRIDRIEVAAERVRAAVGRILEDEQRIADAAPEPTRISYTVLLNAAATPAPLEVVKAVPQAA